MAKFVVNLKNIMDLSARDYISTNVEKFKSTTPGPIGPDGPRGPQGEGVHHMKGTSTTDPEGDFSTAGELDTYTFYADADELFPLAWFTVKNGEDPWRRAVDRGYRGTEEEFYTTLGSLEEYATIALESINITEENKQIVLAAALQVAEDRLVVEDARDIAVEKSDIAKESADAVQIIFLGTKSMDPVVDNQGNPLVVGVMYYNDIIGQLKLWNGTVWTTAAFSADGAVFSFNGRDGAVNLLNSDVTIAVGVNLQTKIPEIEGRISTNEDDIDALESKDADNKLRLDAIEDAHLQLDERVDVLESDVTVIGSIENKIDLMAQGGIYDDENGLGVDTIKEALDKLVLDLYKIKEW